MGSPVSLLSRGSEVFIDVMTPLTVTHCDDLIDTTQLCGRPLVTYMRDMHHSSSVSSFLNVRKHIVRSNLVISGENMSDHLPLSIVFNWSVTNIIHSSKPTVVKQQRLRWDKADLVSYYYGTMHSLSQIDIPVDLQRCLLGRHNNFQDMVNALFLCIIIALHVNADSFVPRAKPGSYRHWWDNALSDLKEHSID